ncbi:hypothetical protein WR25_00829 [Diploscapter pachys]|uniref:Amine oxidase domain-containing protein n=1 Tax=Diploscapter pachys TaxID=2018661 RepID=A0A2A2JV99_9BILA|nr:hypothetical protein WR25_00829 [Diploscapter pachys]
MSMIKIRLVLTVIIACGISIQKESSSEDASEPHIAIVGAGMAGLSAARRLTELGLTQFDVFEGADRIGGRIHPIPYQGGYLQMGAQYINGADNPIYRIAEKLGVVAGVVDDQAHIANPTYLIGNQPIDSSDIDLFLNFTHPLDPKYRDIARDDEYTSKQNTFFELYAKDYSRFLKENNISAERQKLFDALSRSYRSYWEFEWAADWTKLSVHVLKEWNDRGPEGESFATNKFGYKHIIDYIYQQTPEERFHFNERVENIRLENDGVYLTTSKGEILKRYDYVIVTASLGVLKKFHTKMFTPRLPRRKIEAIEKLGFGESCKIFFRWENPWWRNDTVHMVPLPVEGMYTDKITPFEREFTTIQKVDWEPNTLTAWIAGPGHEVMDNLSDEELMEKATKLIRDMNDDQSIEPPSQIIRTKLTKNDLLLGSYSYTTKEAALANITHSRLAIPVKRNGRPRILFAGEGTHYRLFQTAIGAFLSGRREADRAFNDFYQHRPSEIINSQSSLYHDQQIECPQYTHRTNTVTTS